MDASRRHRRVHLASIGADFTINHPGHEEFSWRFDRPVEVRPTFGRVRRGDWPIRMLGVGGTLCSRVRSTRGVHEMGHHLRRDVLLVPPVSRRRDGRSSRRPALVCIVSMTTSFVVMEHARRNSRVCVRWTTRLREYSVGGGK